MIPVVNKRISIKTFAIIVVALILCVVSNLQITEARSVDTLPEASLGDFLGTVVLSGFRPIVVDVLWMKADSMYTDRQYYQLLSIYEFIAKLDPHFENAWVFNAFNLALSLSYLETDAEAQWKWVRHGILFAQKGYEKNKQSDQICFALAWIYYYRVPQNPEFYKFLENDIEINPQKVQPILLAIDWAEKGFMIRPHTVFIDWVLEFCYSSCVRDSKDPNIKLYYQKKRLLVWKYFISVYEETGKANEKIIEIESEIQKLNKELENKKK
ncbi:MAG: hypothetical protein ABIH42_10750 [Planctomycetota bacterium]